MVYRVRELQPNGRPTPEYNSWTCIKRRCLDPKDQDYAQYGGRGISICRRWRYSYAAFLQDMGRRPATNFSVDRTDNDKGYEPSNCRWASPKEQARNRRSSKIVTVLGEQMSLAEACERYGARYDVVRQRVRALRWPVEKALGVSP